MQKRRFPDYIKVLVGMLAGALCGIIAQIVWGADHSGVKFFSEQIAQPVGQLFMRLIFMVVIPLLFSALVLGVCELGGSNLIGKVGLRSLGFTVLFSGIAVALAIGAVNIVNPGVGLSPERREALMTQYGDKEAAQKNVERAQESKGFGETILGFVPENPIEEAAKPKLGGVLPLMFFAVMFGIALASLPHERAIPVKAFLEGLFQVTLKLVEYAMKLAPYGVFGLVFVAAASFGAELFAALGRYAGLVLVVLLIQLVVTYSLALKFVAKRNPIEFFGQMRRVMLTAFATSSSNATLPAALHDAEERLKIRRPIASFVLTCGATANQNGTALFEGITVLFLAQLFGVSLSITDQLTVVGLCILAGVGTAGVPGGAWPMIAAICGQIGVPPAAIALCIGIDRILDMSRTVVNVIGDVTIATCVDHMSTEQDSLEAAIAT